MTTQESTFKVGQTVICEHFASELVNSKQDIKVVILAVDGDAYLVDDQKERLSRAYVTPTGGLRAVTSVLYSVMLVCTKKQAAVGLHFQL